jgi:hypothetical protein
MDFNFSRSSFDVVFSLRAMAELSHTMLPWAKALYEERKENLQKGHPSERCLGHGVTDFDTHATPRRIVQSPRVIAILFESYHQYRQILMDGRALPTEIGQPGYLGYSVGKWDGDIPDPGRSLWRA